MEFIGVAWDFLHDNTIWNIPLLYFFFVPLVLSIVRLIVRGNKQ